MFIEDDYIEEMMQKREGQEPSGLNKYSKRPKLKINKLSEERRSVALQLEIEINDKLVIRERFDWPLDYVNISPALFADRLCTQLGLPEGNVDNIRKQILAQVIDHIEKSTNPLQKSKTMKSEQIEPEVEAQNFDYLGERKDEEEIGTKQTERQRTLEEMRKKGSVIGKFTADGKKECRYCQTAQIMVSEYCKHCKLPFKFSDAVNMEVEREALTLKFLEELIKNIDVIADAELEKILSAEDFKSIYYLRNVLAFKFLELPEVKEENIGKELVNAINAVYKEVLSNVEGINNKEIESDTKSEEAEEKENGSGQEDAESPSKLVQKVIRKRGRPPKKNPAPKKFMLKKSTTKQ